MKKIASVFLCIIMSITVSGCSLFVSSTANKAFHEGKLAMASGDFKSALGYFELAQSEGNNSVVVKDLISVINNYVTALDSYNNGDYENAKKVVESIRISNASKPMSKHVEELKNNIQSGIDARVKIDEKISDVERMFAIGDYAAVDSNIKELEQNDNISDSQRDRVALLKQQLETANGKVESASKAASKANVVYISDSDREYAKNAVSNFVHAYEAFVRNGNRTSGNYYSYMSAYSPSWSTSYKSQWNYFSKHRITSYYVESLVFGSVTYDGNYFYVIDTETISETKDGNFVRSCDTWKYTVMKDGNSFKVINYTRVK